MSRVRKANTRQRAQSAFLLEEMRSRGPQGGASDAAEEWMEAAPDPRAEGL